MTFGAATTGDSPEADDNPAASFVKEQDENELLDDIVYDDRDETAKVEAALERIRELLHVRDSIGHDSRQSEHSAGNCLQTSRFYKDVAPVLTDCLDKAVFCDSSNIKPNVDLEFPCEPPVVKQPASKLEEFLMRHNVSVLPGRIKKAAPAVRHTYRSLIRKLTVEKEDCLSQLCVAVPVTIMYAFIKVCV
jgi:hypothetical protein